MQVFGVVFDGGLNWKENTNTTMKKDHPVSTGWGNRSVDVRPDILHVFFCCTVVSVLTKFMALFAVEKTLPNRTNAD